VRTGQARGKTHKPRCLPRHSLRPKFVAALTLAVSGEIPVERRAVHDQLAKDFPEDTVVQNILLPSLQAAIEFGRGNFAKTD